MKDYENHSNELNTHRTEMLILAILVTLLSFSTSLLGVASFDPTTISYFYFSPTSTWSAKKTASPSSS